MYIAPARWDAADSIVARLVSAGGAHHAQRREVLARRKRPPHKHLFLVGKHSQDYLAPKKQHPPRSLQ